MHQEMLWNAGILYKDFKVVSEGIVTLEDPFTDLDDDSAADSDEVELTQLIEQVCEDLPDFARWKLEQWIFLELDRTQESFSWPRTEDASSDNEEDEADNEPFQPKIKTYLNKPNIY